MEKFPPNLDDGELWLPSDIIRDVGARCHHNHRNHHHHHLHPSDSVGGVLRPPAIDFSVLTPGIGYAEGLARQLAGLASLDHPNQQLRPPPAAVNLPSQFSLSFQGSKGFRPVLRVGSAEEIDVGSVYEGFRQPMAAARMEVPGGVDDGPMPGMSPFGLIKPVEAQVAIFGLKSSSGRGIQRPEELLVQRRAVPVRPVMGTGVFLPRVIHSKNTSKPRERKEEQGQGKQQQQKPTKNNGMALKKTLPSQPSRSPAAAVATAAEIGLPQDWTY